MKQPSMFVAFGILISQAVLGGASKVPTVKTASGILEGSEQSGVLSFKGIPFGQAPVGPLRWEPPKGFRSTATRKATTFGPSCIQQFDFVGQSLIEFLFNNPPPPESEDCLFLNVWTSSLSGSKKPVAFWLYGGGFNFGTGSLASYDGTSFARNQEIVVVTINYRMNVFGFPGAKELFPGNVNLGLMDQDLALQWVQQNIAAFGGDPNRVTIFGQSAGAHSIAHAIQRYAFNPPFHAAIMHSGSAGSMSPAPSFTSFDTLSRAVGCTQAPGAKRLACMKAVPAEVIRTWENGPQGLDFSPVVDNVTAFSNPIQRIRQKKTARVPIIIGAMQDDGSLFTLGETSLPDYLNATVGPFVNVNEVRAAYPGLNDTEIIPTVFRDLNFVCLADLTAGAFVQSGVENVFRYMYGAVFSDLQLFPGAGAWHASEIPEIFGTFNASTATPSEVKLSNTMQTIWANFMKNPAAPPAINWPRYVPGDRTRTLAKLAYSGNVQPTNIVEKVVSALDDGPCDKLWNRLLDF